MFQKSPMLFSLTLITCLVGLLFPIVATAEVQWQLRAGGVWLDTDGGSRQTLPGGDRVVSDAQPDVGLSATAELRLNERIGIEFGAMAIASPELGVRVSSGADRFEVADDLGLQLFGAGINFHLTPTKAVDVYLGPFIGYARFDDLSFVVEDEIFPVRFRVGEELAYGATLGLDVPIGERWSWNVAARYFTLEIDPVGPDGGADPVDLDSLSLGLGVGLRF